MVASPLNSTTFMLLPSVSIVPVPVKVRVSIVFPLLTLPLLLKVRRLNDPDLLSAVQEPVAASKITLWNDNPGP